MLVTGVLVGSIYGAVAMGFSLIFGVVRIVNFAHAGGVVWAMYAVFLVTSGGGGGPYVRFLASSERHLAFGGIVVQREILVGGGVAALSALGLHVALARTWLGKAIRAGADNRRGAGLTGLDVPALQRVAVAGSVASPALAGGPPATLTTLYPLPAFQPA